MLSILLPLLFIGCATSSSSPLESRAQEIQDFEEVSYKKLGSPNFVNKYDGKGVKFKATFIGEWGLKGSYRKRGIITQNRVFVNTRSLKFDVDSAGQMSMSQYPPIIISVKKSNSDFVYSYDSGSTIKVKGLAEKVPGFEGDSTIHVYVESVEKID